MSAQNIADATLEATSQPASARGGLLARHPLISFFVLAFALTWLGWGPWFLSEAGVGLLHYDGDEYSIFINTVGLIVGPTLSAFILTGATEGREGVRRLLRRIVLWRVGLGWYVFALLVIPSVAFASAVVMPGALTSFDAATVPSELIKYVVLGFVALFIGGPVFEEIGWRGFALPRLQRLYGPLAGSVVLGILWSLWHLPLFLIPSWDTPHEGPLDVALYVVFVVALTIIFTWVFNNTKGSVFLTILAHGSVNISILTAFDLFPVPAVTEGFTNYLIGFAVLALLAVALTRGRLGYR